MDKPSWREALISIGFILLQCAGCAYGPGYGAARSEEPPSFELQPTMERPRKEKKLPAATEKQPSQKEHLSPSEAPSAPPLPSKPPAVDGARG